MLESPSDASPWRLYSHNIHLVDAKEKQPKLALHSPVLGLPGHPNSKGHSAKVEHAKTKKKPASNVPNDLSLAVSADASEHRAVNISTYSSVSVLSAKIDKKDTERQKKKKARLERPLNFGKNTVGKECALDGQRVFPIDQALYVGGMPWHLDFCPLDSNSIYKKGLFRPSERSAIPKGSRGPRLEEFSSDFLAVAVHPRGFERNRVGQQLIGPGEVQIWELPRKGSDARTNNLADGEEDLGHLARCVLRIAHDGLVAWDVKWSSDPEALDPEFFEIPEAFPADLPVPSGPAAQSANPNSNRSPAVRIPSIGVLSFVSGNGEVLVLPIPRPDAPEFQAIILSAKMARDITEDARTVPLSCGTTSPFPSRASPSLSSQPSSAVETPATKPAGSDPESTISAAGAADAAAAPAQGKGKEEAKNIPGSCPPGSPPLIRIVGAGVRLRVFRKGTPSSSDTLLGSSLVPPCAASSSASASAAGAVDASSPSCCGWQLAGPKNLLVVGCWDGVITCFKLPVRLASADGRGAVSLSQCETLFHIRPEKMSVRTVAFMPPTMEQQLEAAVRGCGGESASAAADSLLFLEGGDAPRRAAKGVKTKGAVARVEADAGAPPSSIVRRDGSQIRIYVDDAAPPESKGNGVTKANSGSVSGVLSGATPAPYIFLSSGQSGTLRFWDVRDVTSGPLLERVLHRSCVSDSGWTMAGVAGAVAASEDGALRLLLIDAELLAFGDEGAVSQFREPAAANISLTSVVAHDPSRVIFFGGVSGIVAAALNEAQFDCRNRKPHVPIAGMIRDPTDGVLRLLGSNEIRLLDCIYAGGSFWRTRIESKIRAAGGVAADGGAAGGAYYDPDANVMHVRAGGWPGGGAVWVAAAHRCGVVRLIRLKSPTSA